MHLLTSRDRHFPCLFVHNFYCTRHAMTSVCLVKRTVAAVSVQAFDNEGVLDG
jgi:hypothetical protein